jgi:hypothetical protein
MSDKDAKVLGYVAVKPGAPDVLCVGDSCVVAGSDEGSMEGKTIERNRSYSHSMQLAPAEDRGTNIGIYVIFERILGYT